MYNNLVKFGWNENKSSKNKIKHGIDFDTARHLWNDPNRVEIHAPYPLEDRGIMIAKINEKLWTAIFTMRGDVIRIISVRRARKQEEKLYG